MCFILTTRCSISLTTATIISAAPAAETQPIDSQTKDHLEKQLNQRPDRSELVDRNILKGASRASHIAYAWPTKLARLCVHR